MNLPVDSRGLGVVGVAADSSGVVLAGSGLAVAGGLGLVIVVVWLIRRTRPDAALLAPLEVMGDRAWRRADPVWQRRRLDTFRPRGAQPLVMIAAPPEIDRAFDDGPSAVGFEDFGTPDAGTAWVATDTPPMGTPVVFFAPDPSEQDQSTTELPPPVVR